MVQNLLLACFAICLTVLIHTLGLIGVSWFSQRVVDRFELTGPFHRIFAMVGVVLGVFCVIAVEIWMWAGLYAFVGAAPDFPLSLYLSTATFATVGYGDVVPDHGWGMLAALEGLTGFLMIGWSTAFLVSAGIKFGPFRQGEHF